MAAEFDDYLGQVREQLIARGVRAELDLSDDRFGKKIRNATKSKVPFILIAGGEDRDSRSVSFRYRSGEQRNGIPVTQAIEEIASYIASRNNTDPRPEAFS